MRWYNKKRILQHSLEPRHCHFSLPTHVQHTEEEQSSHTIVLDAEQPMDHKSTSEPATKTEIGVQTCCFDKPTVTDTATQTDNWNVCTHACDHGCDLYSSDEQSYFNDDQLDNSADDGSFQLQEIELDDDQVSYSNDSNGDDLQPSCNVIPVIDESQNSLKSNSVAPNMCSNQHQECRQCQMVQDENLRLLRRIDCSSINESTFVNNDEKVKYYTGLPNFATLKLVIQFVSSKEAENKSQLGVFEQILLVLMRLRLNLEQQDLAYRFGISQSMVSKLFNKWIGIMAQCLKPLILWPNKTDLRTSLPNAFRCFFEKCTCIIDCTEIYIERPSNLHARNQTWSNYKHHNTVKVLIAITPQGSISFLSKAWGGRASDKYITEHSGFLDLLLPGDLVLADRGFTIEESVGLYCAQVCVPPFTKGKKQLTRYEVDWSREISHVRIHIERVIGQLKKKYSFLQSVIPITILKNNLNGICTIDCILTVCAALCNMCASVVPFE